VALKLLKPEIASDKETIERFSNELKYARERGRQGGKCHKSFWGTGVKTLPCPPHFPKGKVTYAPV
jgi:hypothetical protein